MPNINDLRYNTQARTEALAKARALPQAHLAELVRVQKAEAEHASRDWRRAAKEYYNMWLNRADFTDKEDWQTKLWIPKTFAAVEQASSIIQRSILTTPNSFGIEGVDDLDKMKADKIWKPLLKLVLEKANMAYAFGDAAKIGFITGLFYLKPRTITSTIPSIISLQPNPQDNTVTPVYEPRHRSMITIDVVPPWNVFRDPESRPRMNYSGTYLYQSEWKDRAYLQAMAEFGWNTEALTELLNQKGTVGFNQYATQMQIEDYQNKERTMYARHKFRNSYLVDEGWLDILDENGEVVLPDALMIHSNGKIIYGPVDNPIWAVDLATGRRKWPFIAGSPIVHPFRFEGRGIAEQDAGLTALFCNVFMLWADGLNWAVNPVTEVWQDALVDMEEDGNIYPGKILKKRVGEAVTKTGDIAKVSTAEIMAALDFIDKQRQNVNFVNDFVTGLPGTRSEITKGEVQIKTGQSMAIFESMGNNLEYSGKQLVELVYNLTGQYYDEFSDPSIQRLIGEEAATILASMPIDLRMDALQGSYDFVFTGVSQTLQKADLLQKLMQFATLTASPLFAPFTNPQTTLKAIVDALGISEHIEIITPPPMPMLPPGMVPPTPGMGEAGGAPPGVPTQQEGPPVANA